MGKKWAEQERKSWRREDEKQKESKRKEEQRKSAKAEEDKKDRDRHSEQEFKDFRRNVDRKKEEKRKEQLQKAKREDAEKEYQRQNKPKACLIRSSSGKVYVAKKLSRGDCKIQCNCRECTCSWNYRSFQSGGGSAGICRIKTPRGLNIMNEKTSAAKCQMECSSIGSKNRCEFGGQVIRRGSPPTYVTSGDATIKLTFRYPPP